MVRIRPPSPITTPLPSRSWPSVAALRAFGTARACTLTMAPKRFRASSVVPASSLSAAAFGATGTGAAAAAGNEPVSMHASSRATMGGMGIASGSCRVMGISGSSGAVTALLYSGAAARVRNYNPRVPAQAGCL